MDHHRSPGINSNSNSNSLLIIKTLMGSYTNHKNVDMYKDNDYDWRYNIHEKKETYKYTKHDIQ